jgi:DNA-binding transcriptional ArsR family regulator
MGQSHSVTSSTPVTSERAEHIARVMAALATASRVRILGRLREGACTVGELVSAVEMAQPAVSQQLRILRDLGLVVGRRTGRATTYSLYDSHVSMLLDEMLRHIEHLQAGTPDTRPVNPDQIRHRQTLPGASNGSASTTTTQLHAGLSLLAHDRDHQHQQRDA